MVRYNHNNNYSGRIIERLIDLVAIHLFDKRSHALCRLEFIISIKFVLLGEGLHRKRNEPQSLHLYLDLHFIK